MSQSGTFPQQSSRRCAGRTAILLSMQIKLPEPLHDAFERWVAGVSARALESLTFAEVRKGAQALSSLYLERRREGRVVRSEATYLAVGFGVRVNFFIGMANKIFSAPPLPMALNSCLEWGAPRPN